MKRKPAFAAGMILSLVLAFILYLLAGRYPTAGFMNPALALSDETARRVLLDLRLPRALGAIVLGAMLSGAGAAFQTIFGNPLVDAGFLGVSQGAAFGAAAALVIGTKGAFASLPAGGRELFTGLSSFLAALLALGASLRLARKFRFGGQVLRLVLAGLAVSAFFSSLLAAVKYVADPYSQLPDIVFWTMGSLAGMDWRRLAATAPVCAVTLLILHLLRWRTNLLALDDDVNSSMGIKPGRERAAVAAIAAVGVAAVTAACGIVSWVGLVVPHIARIIAGPDGRDSFPVSLWGGAMFALAADGLARTAFPGELPLGILTAVFGALLFAAVLAGRSAELAR